MIEIKQELKDQQSKVILSHPEGSLNVWTKFHSNSHNSCGDISLKNTNINLMVAIRNFKGSLKSVCQSLGHVASLAKV